MLEGIPVPTVHRKVGEPNPDQNCRWDIHGRIKVRGPFIEIEEIGRASCRERV